MKINQEFILKWNVTLELEVCNSTYASSPEVLATKGREDDGNPGSAPETRCLAVVKSWTRGISFSYKQEPPLKHECSLQVSTNTPEWVQAVIHPFCPLNEASMKKFCYPGKIPKSVRGNHFWLLFLYSPPHSFIHSLIQLFIEPLLNCRCWAKGWGDARHCSNVFNLSLIDIYVFSFVSLALNDWATSPALLLIFMTA